MLNINFDYSVWKRASDLGNKLENFFLAKTTKRYVVFPFEKIFESSSNGLAYWYLGF